MGAGPYVAPPDAAATAEKAKVNANAIFVLIISLRFTKYSGNLNANDYYWQ
jgi:hypothetical protein